MHKNDVALFDLRAFADHQVGVTHGDLALVGLDADFSIALVVAATGQAGEASQRQNGGDGNSEKVHGCPTFRAAAGGGPTAVACYTSLPGAAAAPGAVD